MSKTRFCPSPTGLMHLGNARTALFNALIAKHSHGDFLLRIEDTDKSRSADEFVVGLKEDLHWMACHWQEGPDVEGPQSPYFQSQRQAIYNKYYQQLIDTGHAYPCFCSDRQLQINRKIQLAGGHPPRYPGTCRHLSSAQIEEKIAQGGKPTLRFRVPDNEDVRFTDLVRGEQRYNTNDIGDFIIRRADGTASFMFCNAVDDGEMGVELAVRGEDHLTNTPRQLMIFFALNLPAPQYAHISLIVGPDGAPLSKRHGSRSLRDLRKMGYLSMGIVNYLARLGHSYESNEYMEWDELAKQFNVNALVKAPARYSLEQLNYWQKQALQCLTDEQIIDWLGEEIIKQVPEMVLKDFVRAIRSNIHFPNEAKAWITILFTDHSVISEENRLIIQSAGPQFFEAAMSAVDNVTVDYLQLCHVIKQAVNVKGKELFQPLRVALTGEMHGPEMAPLLGLMKAEHVLARFNDAKREAEKA